MHYRIIVSIAIVGGVAMPARAQSTFPDIEVPTEVIESTLTETGRTTEVEIDLANIVQSAARGKTTVQKAPAIVTVITADEIADRQFRTLGEIVNTVPGWMHINILYGQNSVALARGQNQATQLLHDGLSLFDPYLNIATISRVQPVELIKRVELITGPGGVLWGSNSLLGIMNIISKDAGDVDGIEVGGTLGGGNGDRDLARAYLMAGAPDLLDGAASVFFHGSVESYVGPGLEMPGFLFGNPPPQPDSVAYFGPMLRGEPPRSLVVNLDGKLRLGRWQLRVHAPLADQHTPLATTGVVVREHLGEDNLRDMNGNLACPYQEPYGDPLDACADRGRRARDNAPTSFDRYAVLEYQRRLAAGRAGVSIKAYGAQFVRRLTPVIGAGPVPGLLEGGLVLDIDPTSYRYGAAVDGDALLGKKTRILYGTEIFHELALNDVVASRQGPGIEVRVLAPYDYTILPLPCPRDVDTAGELHYLDGCPLTWGFAANRTVLGTYGSAQWRITPRLILDLGGRLQVAPSELGRLSYPATPTFAGTIVYELARDWHIKLNAAQGFRPPVFNNVVSNSEAVAVGGRQDLAVETSTAGQAEINARLYRGERQIRELGFRADYSYTLLENLIQIAGGRYYNAEDRGLHSAELLAKLYLQGGHRIELAYTWLQVQAADIGHHRSLPEHWLSLGAVWNLVDKRLRATTTLRVIGAMEDMNRIVEHRDYQEAPSGQTVNAAGIPGYIVVKPYEVVADRLPPVADLAAGMTWQIGRRLEVRGAVHNALGSRYYYPDVFLNYAPRLENLPNPAEDLRAYVSATYKY